ncbi:4-hydroxy-3-methylbut-2-enyl diphosphate reductase [Desulfovibrio sp. OttesenSCG-928-C14]|nr:4-hydroxy-3-methylbut-2-enyl diphosphate reductase [Desulfovibrio sp. OttesenSCG-928-C14]
MRVIKAETAGFCMGVSLALKRLDRALGDRERGGMPGRLCTFGPIIHNPPLVKEYEERGVICMRGVEEARPGDTVLIRAHGVPLELEEELKARGADVVDATCPRVKAAQLAIKGAASEGRGTLLLFGEAEHPEVKGLLSYAGPGAVVFSRLEELHALGLEKSRPCFLAAQTTQDRNVFQKAADYLQGIFGENFTVLHTICDATRERQQEVIELAGKVRSMVIVGGMNSGNTTRLAEIARGLGIYTVHCEDGCELPLDELRALQPVGLSAGASTPDKHIAGVEELLLQS